MVTGPGGPIETRIVGDREDPALVLLPSLGRGASDFDDLAERLAAEGYLTVCPQPRGIGDSYEALDELTMFDLAADVAAVIDALGVAPATVVGHAFGNRVARMTATEHHELVDRVVLLACGGLVAPEPEHAAALLRVFDTALTAEEHLDAVNIGFFAPGNDPSVWSDGWHPAVATAQSGAARSLPSSHWWRAGQAEVLVVQPADDVIALPENAQAIADELGERASVVTVSNAGHALLPEQPAAVADAVLTWLQRR